MSRRKENGGGEEMKQFTEFSGDSQNERLKQLYTAHTKWKALPEKERGVFNISWLQKNGFSGLTQWMNKNGGAEHFADLAGGEIQTDFERSRVTRYTSESAILKLTEAHTKWKELPETGRGVFNTAWLQKNGYEGSTQWMHKNGGAEHFADLAGGEVKTDFERSHEPTYTSESAILKLTEAHTKWKELPEKERGFFNIRWLMMHGYSGLYSWILKNGGAEHFADLAGGEVKTDFEKSVARYTVESATLKLTEAHTKWKELPEKERGVFNIAWLQKNGYSGLPHWMNKNGGSEHFVNLVGGEVQIDFEKSFNQYTPESAVKSLIKAHTKWKELPETERGFFNTRWLMMHGYSGLYSWILKNGGVEHFADLAGGEIQTDFERSRVTRYTPELAILKITEAHTKWKTLPEKERGVFNIAWLNKNGYNGLINWMRGNGGVKHFVDLAGEEVASDFRARNVPEDEKTKRDLEDFIRDVAEGESDIAQHFQALIRVLGASHCADILYKFHPEYKALPSEYVGGILADYLGDYLLVHGEYRPSDIKTIAQDLSDLSFQEAVYEAFKDKGLRYYFDERRKGNFDSQAIIYGYLDSMVEEFHQLNCKELDDIIERVVLYYDSVFKDFRKPEKFIAELSATREFPDINQRINMKELTTKKRLLIADEMGLGKSASVIMAKEQIGVRCALVVVPSNVSETWQRYLSDNSEQGGYFKKGQVPRVLVIESKEDLAKAAAAPYDYIIVSQERLSREYAHDLQGIDYDMLIVDEVHKLKTLEGKRTPMLFELAERVQTGENRYLALLSGTPVPNKIRDIAIVLKLLYPKKFDTIDDRRLANQIIYGDVEGLRALLIPFMQMKKLEEGIEMPKLTEHIVEISLSALEQQVYEVLLEDDELRPTEKMRILRQFLLNPRLIDSTPGIKSTKIEKTSELLRAAFATHQKAVLFVNDYIEGVVRGEHPIINELALPEGVEVRVIHGENKKEREDIQREFKATSGKMLLVVSGQTADVGVDFSSADYVCFYNEPWTEYQRKQELGRVYRPGLAHDLGVDTIIASGTIEDGLHQYILHKYRAVEKLLRGIPLTELEKEQVSKDEKIDEPDISLNPELARYYFSVWDKMMKMFGYVKEIGEVDFKKFLEKHGHDYASGYMELGNRSYQANVNRVAGTLIHEMAESAHQVADTIRIIDLASGPEMLKQHIGTAYQDRVFSMDINKEHFAERKGARVAVGSILQLPFASHSFDYANAALSLHYLDFAPSKGKLERLQSLMEINRVLKPGGKAVVSIVYSMQFKNFDQLKEAVGELGFRVVDNYTGDSEAGDHYHAFVVTLEKVRDIDEEITVEKMSEKLGVEKLDGLKLGKQKRRIKNQRKIVTEFEMEGKHFDINFNERDKAILQEEQDFLAQGNALKQKYGSVKEIPEREIIENNFVRFRVRKSYILFKKLVKGSGVVWVK